MAVVALVPVDWWVPSDDPMDIPSYRTCDICFESAAEDVWAGTEFRQFWREFGDAGGDLVICEKCLDGYLSEPT